MDGVVGITQDAIPAGHDFTYKFQLSEIQAGTFWYNLVANQYCVYRKLTKSLGIIHISSFKEVTACMVDLSFIDLSYLA